MNIENDKFPLKPLQSWLKESIEKCINPDRPYTSTLVKKNFISNDNMKRTPILRIANFLQVTKNKDLTAVLSDSTHKILAIFPFKPTIINFEEKYQQRITFHTNNTLIHIKQANLRFVQKEDLSLAYDVRYSSYYDVIVLEILDLDIFQRDQIELIRVTNSMTYLYDESSYIRFCGRTFSHNPTDVMQLEEDYEDMISL
ncbi:Shelterin complex subunit, TPP1/ACD-domain-containing protein [Scheffersomyces xylosifermentans]|uniref:Shelterin complex subunit, TPP1/ACD-domain-containing protein n=1 Tax=Scheffersomyces xylosifermentans TaxID=1304137 RepID=UPI00315C669E